MPLSQYLRLMDVMARMALRADASRFFLGYIWWVLEPLLWVGVFYIVFVLILGSRQPDFLPFLMVGKLAFVWFSKSVTQASNSIITGRGLVGKVSVSKTLFPMAIVQEGLYRQAAVFFMMFVFLLSTGYEITATWFLPCAADDRKLCNGSCLRLNWSLSGVHCSRLHAANRPVNDVSDVYVGHLLGRACA